MKAEHPFSKKWISLRFFYPQTLLKTKKPNKLTRTQATERLGAAFQTRQFQTRWFQTPTVSRRNRDTHKSPTAPKQKQTSLHWLPAGRNLLKASTLREDMQVGCEYEDHSTSTSTSPTTWHFLSLGPSNHCAWAGILPRRQILYQLSHKGSPRILEWVAYPFFSRSSWPRNQTGVSCIAGIFLYQLSLHGSPDRSIKKSKCSIFTLFLAFAILSCLAW